MTREEKSKATELKLKQEEENKLKKEKRKKIIKRLLIFIIILISFFLYSRFISTSFLEVREYKVESDKLPESFNGFKIIQLSDIHYGSTINKKELENVIKKINELKPDLVVFTGDLISEDIELTENEQNTLISLLNSINATTGKYAVNGNHDNKEILSNILLGSNFKYLDNTYDLIYYKSENPILLTGISSSLLNESNITNSFQYQTTNNEIYTISLFHEPDQIDNILSQYKTDLALSGHSHNGQIRLPFIGAIVKMEGAKKYANEYYQINNTKLYISGGLGTSIVKYRLFNHPSINLFRLYKK